MRGSIKYSYNKMMFWHDLRELIVMPQKNVLKRRHDFIDGKHNIRWVGSPIIPSSPCSIEANYLSPTIMPFTLPNSMLGETH
jgi:hypothetical protein